MLPEAGAIIESLRAVAEHPAAELAIRGYLGQVDAMVVRWISGAGDEHVTARTIADLGVGA